MIKRDIIETVHEYDNEGNLIKKTVTETHEEDNNANITYPSWANPSWTYMNFNSDKTMGVVTG